MQIEWIRDELKGMNAFWDDSGIADAQTGMNGGRFA